MRYSPVTLCLSLALACVSSTVLAQKPDDQINPQSVAFMQRGQGALAAGNYQAAIDQFESALVIDPRNLQAYVMLGRVAQAQGLPGRAIGLYRQALAIDPNDLAALSGQGEAMVERGATNRAEANLKRIRALCQTECAPAKKLSAAIAKGPPKAVTVAQVPTIVPPPEKEPASAE